MKKAVCQKKPNPFRGALPIVNIHPFPNLLLYTAIQAKRLIVTVSRLVLRQTIFTNPQKFGSFQMVHHEFSTTTVRLLKGELYSLQNGQKDVFR